MRVKSGVPKEAPGHRGQPPGMTPLVAKKVMEDCHLAQNPVPVILGQILTLNLSLNNEKYKHIPHVGMPDGLCLNPSSNKHVMQGICELNLIKLY